MLRPNVPLTFVNADVAKDQIMALVRARPEPPRAVVLDIGATADLDVATTDMLAALHRRPARGTGIELRLSQVRGSVRDRMRRTGLMATIGEERCFLSDEAAVAAPLPERPAAPARRGGRADEPPTGRAAGLTALRSCRATPGRRRPLVERADGPTGRPCRPRCRPRRRCATTARRRGP